MTKSGDPYAPVTKRETLMARQFTPMTKCGAAYAISRNLETSNPLRLKSLFTKRGIPDLQTLETIE